MGGGQARTVAVIGAGTMGSGIAQVVAQAGSTVILQDVEQAFIDRGLGRIRDNLGRQVQKGRMTADEQAAILARFRPTLALEELAAADLVVEAAPEKLELKCSIFRRLQEICRPDAILASNTSSLPITAIAAATKSPHRVVGTHFMNPVPVMKGVELVKGRHTSPETIEQATAFVRSIGKVPTVALDYAGFITSRVLNIYLNEAACAVMDGNTPRDVDDAMIYCTNMPQGPCALMDMVGIDVIVYVMEVLEAEFGPKFKVSPLLRQMVRAGDLGQKTGRGFFQYNTP